MQPDRQSKLNDWSNAPIGVFDSGIGGLSVLAHIVELLPHENIIYVADQAHVPYGGRPLDEICQYCHAITQFLIQKKVKLIVIACNTASAASLTKLRQYFPHVLFVGMEAAVKPAANISQTKVVGILATSGTFASQRYADLMTAYAKDIHLIEDPCIGLVELIEAGDLKSAEIKSLLEKITQPMLTAQADALILGCTHYPFVQPVLEQVVGDQVSIINPAPAIGLQTRRLLQQYDLLAATNQKSTVQYFTTDSLDNYRALLKQLIGYDGVVSSIMTK